MTESIRVLIADDHPIVRAGLRGLIATEPLMEVIGEAADGTEVVDLALSLAPDVIVVDLVMPPSGGIDAISKIMSSWPEARVLVLTNFTEDELVFSALKAGALGYLLKDSMPDELLEAIRQVSKGGSSLHPSIARLLVQELRQPSDLPPTGDPLTDREMEVLLLIAKGLSNRDIADMLKLSEGTVGGYATKILDKLHVANRTQAALYALREGIASLDSE